MDVSAPAQIVTAPAQFITAPAQPPATGAVVYTAFLFLNFAHSKQRYVDQMIVAVFLPPTV